MGRVGIYGGTFNPPHIGHMAAAAQAVRALKLDRLLLIPASIAPHKAMPETSATPIQRLKMVQLSSKDIAGAEVSDIELLRSGKSYSYETVLQLKKLYPDDELVLIVGTDMFLSFHTWMHPENILENAVIGVLYRGEPGELAAIRDKKEQMEKEGARIELVNNDVLQMSSTDLRRMLVFGCADSLLPPGVGDYIRDNGLYGTKENYHGLTMQQLEKAVVSLLKEDRVHHVLGCRDAAVDLARHWGANETDAARAGLLHDITKALPGFAQLTLCREYGTIPDDFSTKNPKVLHALTGSLVAQRIFGENESVVQAICAHTTGKPYMNLLDKIIYVADYMEPNRKFPGVDKLRQLAYTDLDAAVVLGLTMSVDLLTRQGKDVCPVSMDTLAWLKDKGKGE